MLDSGLKITKLVSSSKGLSPLGPCKISLRLLNQEKKNIHLCIVQYCSILFFMVFCLTLFLSFVTQINRTVSFQ